MAEYNPKLSEEEAHQSAVEFVCQSLKKHEHLDGVDQMKRNAINKKAFIEARLKSSVQNQLDNVKNGLDSLKNALVEIKDVKENMSSIDLQLDQIDDIKHVVGPLRELNDSWVIFPT